MLREGLTSAQHALHQRSQRPTHDLFPTNNSLLSFGSSPLLPSSLVISFSYSLLPCVSNIHRALFLFKMVWICAALQTFSCDELAYIPISCGGSRETQTPEKIPKLYVEASAASHCFTVEEDGISATSLWMCFSFLYSAHASEPGFICCAPTKPSLWYSNLEMLLDHDFND